MNNYNSLKSNKTNVLGFRKQEENQLILMTTFAHFTYYFFFKTDEKDATKFSQGKTSEVPRLIIIST
jgi:hypothetical protein